MWAVFWNSLLFGKQVKIHHEMHFCWATSPLKDWHSSKILHYTGGVSLNDVTKFRKVNYVNFSPYYDSKIKSITNETCSYALALLIEQFVKSQKNERIELTDVTFLILTEIDSNARL